MTTLTVHLTDLESGPETLRGRVPAEYLRLGVEDELVHPTEPLDFDLEVAREGVEVLVRGTLRMDVPCECARCLEPVVVPVVLDDWAVMIPLEGDDAAELEGDMLDLTPYVREDILLALPQHPHCGGKCRGLPPDAQGSSEGGSSSSVWGALDQLGL